MPIRTGGTAPYAPPQTVLHVINQYRERGLTTPISETVLLKASVSESLAPRTLAALKTLDLLDADGNPTAEMEGLRRAKTDEFAPRMEAIIRSVYAEVFQYADPAKDDATKVADAFRDYEPAGQRARMVTLFMGLCQAAGIVPDGAVQKRAPVLRKKPGNAKRPASFGARSQLRADDGGMIPPAISGLLASLPVNGTGWTAAQRQSFVDTFEKVLDFVIPIRTATEIAANLTGNEPEEDDDA